MERELNRRLDTTVTVAIELIGGFTDGFGASSQGAFVQFVHVRNEHIKVAWLGRPRFARLPDHDDGIADAHFCMANVALIIGVGEDLFPVKGALQKVNLLGRIGNRQVLRQSLRRKAVAQ